MSSEDAHNPRIDLRFSGTRAMQDLETREAVVESYAETSELARRWSMLRRHLLLLLLAAIVGGSLGFYLQKRKGRLYVASTTVRFRDTRASLTGSNSDDESSWQTDPVQSQAELLTTRATIEGAVDSGLLQLRPLAGAQLTWLSDVDVKAVLNVDTLRFRFNQDSLTATFHGQSATSAYGEKLSLAGILIVVAAKPPIDAARFVVVPRDMVSGELRRVVATRRTDTDIVDFTLLGTDPDFVPRALNSLTLSLQALSRSTDQSSAQERRRFLDEQVRKTDSILEVQRSRLSEFRTRTQAFSAKEKVTQQQQALSNVRTRREELAADRDVFVSLLNSAVTARNAGDPSRLKSLIGAPGISDNRLIADLFTKLQRLSLTRDSITQGPFASATTNPDVQGILVQIESTTDDLIAAIRSQIATFNARIAALDSLVARGAAEVSALPPAEAEEERLLQDQAATQRVADELNDEQQRARIAELAQGGKVDVIDLATFPASQLKSGASRRAILGALLALGLAVVFVFLREELTTSLKRQDDVERLLGLPTLGSIPSLGKKKLGPANGLMKRLGSGKAAPPTALAVKSTSQVFESYRAIRTSLIFSNAVESLRSVAITSASPSDGKSTTVVNLATVFAQQGLKVLAVDLDLRRGSLHRLLRVPRVPGLTNAIATGEGLESIVRETSIPNLSIVTTGVQPPNPSELLGSDRVRQLLLEAQTQYDLVLIDTPPVLAAADAAIVSSMVDGVILIVRVGATSKRSAKTAHDRLTLVGARILGTVLNDPKEILEVTEHYYYYDYAGKAEV